MKFSKNSILKNLNIKNINTKKLLNILNNNGFESNFVEKIYKNMNIIIGKIKKILKKKKNNICFIEINKKKIVNIFIDKNLYLKLNSYIFLYKKINNNKCIKNNIYKYYFYSYLYCKNINFNINKNIINKKFFLKDEIIDIKIPFNRPDCLNIYGISREISIIKNIKLKNKNIKNTCNIKNIKKINVFIYNKKLCEFYCYRIIENINLNNIIIPIFITNFLKNLSIKIKNNIEDIIKFISIKIGYYIHIIDFNFIKNGIYIKNNLKKHNYKNININEYIPTINDFRDNIILVPNIYNNINIKNNTKNILIGCSIFNSNLINLNKCDELIKNNFYKYKNYNNLKLIKYSIEYLTNIITWNNICNIYSIIIPREKKNFIKKKININFKEIRKKINLKINNKSIVNILIKIKCKINFLNKDNIVITTPIFRTDLIYIEDIIEEIIKMYGIDKIKTKKINLYNENNINNYNNKNIFLNKIKNILIYKNYQEIITFTLINNNIQNKLYNYDKKQINIINPISKENSLIRSSLITGIIENIIYNKNRKEYNIKIFEIGNCFKNKNNIIIKKMLLSGAILTNKNNIKNVFYKIKNDIKDIICYKDINVNFNYSDNKINNNLFLIKELSLSINIFNKKLGFIGIFNNKLINLNIKYNIIIFEINLDTLYNIKKIYIKKNIENYNFNIICKDISIIIKKNINIENMIFYIKNIKTLNLYNLELIDFYNTNSNKYKYITIRLFIKNFFNNNKTNFDYINNIIKLFIYNIKKKFYLKIR